MTRLWLSITLLISSVVSAAETPEYACRKITYRESGDSTTHFTVKGSWEEFSEADSEHLSLTARGKNSTVSYTQGFDGPSRRTFEMTCDQALNCSASRVSTVAKETNTISLTIAPRGASVTALYKRRELIRFETRYRGFSYRFIQYLSPDKKEIGFEVICEN